MHKFTTTIILFSLIILCQTIPVVTEAAGMVRVIYFVPSDRTFQWMIPQALDTQIKKVQTLYADQMEAHGYGRKTFDLETDTSGALVVHPFFGQHDDTHYHEDALNKIAEEISVRFNIESDLYLVVIDVSTERVGGNCGKARYDGGPAMVPASGDCVADDKGIALIAHELGHAFNLVHDFRSDLYIMSYGYDRIELSDCAAGLLNVNPFFNDTGDTENTAAEIEMLSSSTYSAKAENVPVRFSVSDSDGIYQVQFEHAVQGDVASLSDCKKFDNTPTETETVEFTLPPDASSAETNHIWIRVVDLNGNITTKEFLLEATEEITTETAESITYLTLSYEGSDSLVPTNPVSEWDGWRGDIWEKKPDGKITEKPIYYVNHPYVNVWENWFYAHAEGRYVYDISGKGYTRFECLFYLANPCSSAPPAASMEVIGVADETEIYRSGVFSGVAEKEKNRHPISFDIPAGTQTLTISITDGHNGSRCDHFVVGNMRVFYFGTESETTTETIETDRTETYLTLTYDSPDAIVPTNPRLEWYGWATGVWEKTPDGFLTSRPHGFVDIENDNWDYFFYSHATSRLIYDISGGDYVGFEAQFDMPNPCGSIASIEIQCLADDVEIYNSGTLYGQYTRNIPISFDIPENTNTLTINVTDAGDGDGCDHFIFGNARLIHRETTELVSEYTDVNNDGVVNVIDLVLVAVRYGERIEGDTFPNPDVNRDGVVDVNDIILVTQDMPPVVGAPSLLANVDWQPAYTALPDTVVDKGISVLGSLFGSVVPAKTLLFANYPNPFNPETWIPYQLAKSADVTVHIYAVNGSLVRTLAIGYQAAGMYQNRSLAAYWDGNNELGETVSSGVYFYTLTAGEFSATRKMLILE